MTAPDRLTPEAVEAAIARALASGPVRAHLGDGEPRRVVARPPKLVNVVP